MKVIGIVGSPRKGGNTDILIDEVLKGARDANFEVEKIFLNDLKIDPCQAECSDYCKKTGNCKINDDMPELYEKLYESNIIVLGTPIYWYGPTAQAKTFIDRWYPFSHPQYLGKMKGKKMILISPFEESDTSVADPLINMITKSLGYLGIEFHEKLLVSVGERGAVRNKPEVIKHAYEIGAKLV